MSTAEPAFAPILDPAPLAALSAALPPKAVENLESRLIAAAAGTAETRSEEHTV